MRRKNIQKPESRDQEILFSQGPGKVRRRTRELTVQERRAIRELQGRGLRLTDGINISMRTRFDEGNYDEFIRRRGQITGYAIRNFVAGMFVGLLCGMFVALFRHSDFWMTFCLIVFTAVMAGLYVYSEKLDNANGKDSKWRS